MDMHCTSFKCFGNGSNHQRAVQTLMCALASQDLYCMITLSVGRQGGRHQVTWNRWRVMLSSLSTMTFWTVLFEWLSKMKALCRLLLRKQKVESNSITHLNSERKVGHLHRLYLKNGFESPRPIEVLNRSDIISDSWAHSNVSHIPILSKFAGKLHGNVHLLLTKCNNLNFERGCFWLRNWAAIFAAVKFKTINITKYKIESQQSHEPAESTDSKVLIVLTFSIPANGILKQRRKYRFAQPRRDIILGIDVTTGQRRWSIANPSWHTVPSARGSRQTR